jgi:molecular chaperone GrpE
VTDLDPAASGLDEGTSAEEAPSAAEEVFVDGTVGRSELAAERDEYLEALQRVKAEFDNYRKRVDRERLQMVDRAGEKLVTELLPVLDACDAAVAQGDEGVRQIRAKLLEVLGKEGLEPMESEGKPFDPNLHEAVLREEGDGVGDLVVVEIMRSGYTWRGRVLRPAMVKVRS